MQEAVQNKEKNRIDDFAPAAKEWRRIGFRALLGWHYLILFAPFQTGINQTIDTGFLFYRQSVLYITLAFMFTLIAVFSHFVHDQKKQQLSIPLFAFFACVMGCGSTLVAGIVGASSFFLVQTITTICLGISEAFLMSIWLNRFVTLGGVNSYRKFGTDVILGGVIAFLVECLVFPVRVVAAVCLPFIASLPLICRSRGCFFNAGADIKEQTTLKDSPHERGISEIADEGLASSKEDFEKHPAQQRWLARRKTRFGFMVWRVIPTAVYAFVFGLVQGSFLHEGIMVLLATNKFAFLGIMCAGLCIFFISEQFCTHADADVMHRLSLALFVCGAVALSLMGIISEGYRIVPVASLLLIADIVILAGFNLFDFGGIVLASGFIRRYGKRYQPLLDGGRAVVYICLTIGLLLGAFLLSTVTLEMSKPVLLGICCISIVLLVITSIAPSMTPDFVSNLMTLPLSTDLDKMQSYIEDTKETLTVLCGTCGSADDCQIRPALDANVKASEQIFESMSNASQASEDAVIAGGSESERAMAGRKAGGGDTAKGQTQGGGSNASQQMNESTQRRKMPWRSACKEIAERYQLSNRETEIFRYIAKGRNAEYVSQKLVISTHTAKTHIANIYQKLDVHSLQEMLDLIDAFQDLKK